MEYLENEESKGVYWIIFFLFIIVIIIFGYYFVFEKGVNNKENNTEIKEETVEESIEDYIGIWKTIDSDDSEIIEDYELTIIKIDGSTIIFDLKLTDDFIFNNQFGDIDENRASFDIDKDNVKISGELSFKDNRIYLSVLSSTEDDIPIGTMRFDNKE